MNKKKKNVKIDSSPISEISGEDFFCDSLKENKRDLKDGMEMFQQ